jgi:hypothetical protein
MLIGAISNPPADWDAWMKDTTAKLGEELATLKKG